MNNDELKAFLNLYENAVIEDEKWGNLLLTENEWQYERPILQNHPQRLSHYFIMQLHEKLIWYIQITPIYPRRQRVKHNYRLWPLYIHDQFRWNGYGKHLVLSAIEQILTECEYTRMNITLTVSIHNIAAQKIYTHCWFEKIWIEKDHTYIHTENTYIDAIHMQKIVYV